VDQRGLLPECDKSLGHWDDAAELVLNQEGGGVAKQRSPVGSPLEQCIQQREVLRDALIDGRSMGHAPCGHNAA
jgi:hypothetical protein